MKFNAFGNLDGGIVTVNSINDVENYFVNAFTESNTRRRNFEGFINFISELENLNITQYISKYWIDGSFASKKLDPNDIDLIILLDASQKNIEAVTKIMSDLTRDKLRQIGLNNFCDTYFLLDIDTIPQNEQVVYRQFDFQTSYWMGKFGFDRNRNPKGIMELINSEEVMEYAI